MCRSRVESLSKVIYSYNYYGFIGNISEVVAPNHTNSDISHTVGRLLISVTADWNVMRRRSSLFALRVATHNIMNGQRLPALLRQYKVMQCSHATRLHALFMQEAVPGAARGAAAALSTHARKKFAIFEHPSIPRLSIIYDRNRLRPIGGARLLRLPRLEAIPFWQRMYASGIEQRYALVGRFEVLSGRTRKCSRSRTSQRTLTFANFHLDHIGPVEHLKAQVRALSRSLPRRYQLIGCGDTNAFTFDASGAEAMLAALLQPLLERHGCRDPHASHPKPTHFFARQNEAKLTHQLAVAFGALGIDFPRRYDVCVSGLCALDGGYQTTEDSDHDIVWATFDTRTREPTRSL